MSTTERELVRIVEGREIPPAGYWTLDPADTQIQLIARHMMVSRVRGFFRGFQGLVTIEAVPEQSAIDVTIDASSIDTGDATRDNHLRSSDFLDVETYPVIRYRSTSVTPGEKNKWIVTGDLTIKEATRPVDLDVEFSGVHADPWGKVRAGFVATAAVNREDFGITWNQALETGGFLIGKGVGIEIDAEVVLDADSDIEA